MKETHLRNTSLNNRDPLPKFGLAAFGATAVILGIVGFSSGATSPLTGSVRPLPFPARTLLACVVAACEALLAGYHRNLSRAALPAPAWPFSLSSTPSSPRSGSSRHSRHPPSTTAGATSLNNFLWSPPASPPAQCSPRPAPVGPAAGPASLASTASCPISFGVYHIIYWRGAAPWVPAWLPPGQVFWIFFTAICFLLAAAAILAGIRARLAALLLTAEILGFRDFVWIPKFAAGPHDHSNWSGNAINLALMSAAWVVADAFSTKPQPAPTS